MKYLKSFNKRLLKLRNDKQMSQSDIADLCSVDATVVEAWESTEREVRCYPSLENLLDLCFKTGQPLESLIDKPPSDTEGQLELPGLRFIEESDLSDSLVQLDKALDSIIPTEDEQELLRRYRKSDAQNKELILQLIAN